MRLPLIVCMLCLPFLAGAQETAQEILDKMMQKVQKHKSISYEANFKEQIKDRDTTRLSGIVHLLRDNADTVMGGMIWISEGIKYNTYSFCDKNNRYVVMNNTRTAIKQKITQRHSIGMEGFAVNMYLIPFLHAKYWEKKFRTIETKRLNDTTINGIPCYAVECITPMGPNERYNVDIYYINKVDFFMIAQTKWQHFSPTLVEYFMLEISNYAFDKVTEEQFSPNQIPNYYKIESKD